MKYVKLDDVKKILSDMQSKVTMVQRPALDDFERAVSCLEVHEINEINEPCEYCDGNGVVILTNERDESFKGMCRRCEGKGNL